MYSLKDCQEIIENELIQQDFYQGKEPRLLYDPVKYILSIGGKRIRPSVLLLACNLFTDDINDAIYPALAMEVFHNFTLLHDDIMDASDVRRGNVTVHKKWNDNVAILSGDAMAILSYQLLVKTNSPNLKSIIEIFNKVAVEVCEGQQYDMDFETSNEVRIEDYLKMIELKTSVLIAGSLKIGALIGGADEHNAHLIYQFGRNIGLAFQMQDDYLDVFGDPTKFQKFIGGDIVANKKTYLLIKAFELANSDQENQLQRLLSDINIAPQEKVDKVTSIFRELKVDELILAAQEEYFSSAIAALKQVNVSDDRKEIMRDFAYQLLKRTY